MWDEFYLIMVDDLLDVSVDLISKCVIWKFSEDQSAILFVGSLLDLAVKVAG